MAYRFELDESLADGVRRIGCEQIDEAIQQLGKNPDPHHGIHEARKALKRLRALLRLARPALRERDFKSEYRGFRDIGRELSKARDAQAMFEAVRKLNGRSGPEAKAGAERVSRWIKERRGAALRSLDKGPKDAVVASLREAGRRFGQLRVKGGFDRIGKGLQRSYRGGRRAFVRAYDQGRDEDFHDWRKRVQQHWRHMQLIEAAWPDVLNARVELAKELSQILGDDQDLYMLCERLRHEDESLTQAPEIQAFLSACREHQSELRAAAKPRGDRLFVDRPRAFRERMTACWNTARRLPRGHGEAAAKKEKDAGHTAKSKPAPIRAEEPTTVKPEAARSHEPPMAKPEAVRVEDQVKPKPAPPRVVESSTAQPKPEPARGPEPPSLARQPLGTGAAPSELSLEPLLSPPGLKH